MSAAASASMESVPPFGFHPWSKDEQVRIEHLLEKHLDDEDLATRPGPGGQSLQYVKADRLFAIVNKLFAFNGWRNEIRSTTVDFMDQERDGQWTVCISTCVRVELKDGTWRENYGVGDSKGTKVAAFKKARKQSVTDALKRCFALFGNQTGGTVYNKDHLAVVSDRKRKAAISAASVPKVPVSLPIPPPPAAAAAASAAPAKPQPSSKLGSRISPGVTTTRAFVPPKSFRPSAEAPYMLRDPSFAEIEEAEERSMKRVKPTPVLNGITLSQLDKVEEEYRQSKSIASPPVKGLVPATAAGASTGTAVKYNPSFRTAASTFKQSTSFAVASTSIHRQP